jgi:hypothetical protein
LVHIANSLAEKNIEKDFHQFLAIKVLLFC